MDDQHMGDEAGTPSTVHPDRPPATDDDGQPGCHAMARASRAKRLVDVVAATVGLGALSPVLALTAVAIRVTLGSPVLFRQHRPGLDGGDFVLYKFRTMTDGTDAAGTVLPDSARLTPLGRALRVTSIDELPELWNVLKGDMSLVGPRPLLHRYTDHLTPREQRRLQVRPGITGLAQVNGRNGTPWTERLAQDVSYVDNWSLGLDLQILLTTLVKVLRREGVVADTASSGQDLDEERRHR